MPLPVQGLLLLALPDRAVISRTILIHYHEIALKGKNRFIFENCLVDNVRRALRKYEGFSVNRIPGYLRIELASDEHSLEIAALVRQIPGVARVSVAYHTNQNEDTICKAASLALGEYGAFETFKVHAHRANTSYHLHTLEINQLVGSHLCAEFPDKSVRMHGPDVTVMVLVIQSDAYIYTLSERGVGGLPVGTAGKVISLLSSGFDSPVATWMVGRRGAICIPVHFSGRPMVTNTSEYLCQDLIRVLAPSGCIPRLYVVPFGEHQRRISLAVPQSLRILMYRRIMYLVAERIAELEEAKALVTGESLGQVASQTLENISAVDQVVHIPVLRPLIGSDKQEIIERAQQLGTYDICSRQAPDCCTLFMPRQPETRAHPVDVRNAWDMFDHDAFVDELVDLLEYVDFDQCFSYRPPSTLREKHVNLQPVKNRVDR